MSKSSDASNAVVNAIEQVCGLYGVDCFRMQSRVIMVEGAAGRMRPMYFGKWKDRFGEVHSSGMADILARPRINLPFNYNVAAGFPTDSKIEVAAHELVTIPLWIEGKSGSGRLSPKQRLFKAHVEWNGETYLEIADDVRPLIDWFESRGLKKCAACGGTKWIHPANQRLATPCSQCNPRSEFKK